MTPAFDPRLERFAEAMPKVELHVHLEGSIRPSTLFDLARRHRISLPADTVEGLRRWYRFESFEQFVEIYLTCSRCLRDPEDFQRLLRDFAAEQERQNVRYCEAHFTIATHLLQGSNGQEVAHAMGEAIEEIEKKSGVRIRLIPDIVRQLEPSWADATVEWALEHRHRGVIALGLGGIEAPSALPFREHFRAAEAEGLHRVAHAGEQCGPPSVRETLEVARPERLGHGIRSVEDPELVAELADSGLPLEVCPSSNVALGNASSLEEHPIGELLSRGVRLSINSDDPPMFGTDLSREYARVAETLGLGAGALAGLSLEAVRHAFLADADREAMLASFEEEMLGLGERLFDATLEIEPFEALSERR